MSHSSSLTRRQFIRMASQTGLVAALAGTVRIFTVESSLIRPPGARPELQLLSRCVKCHKCEQVCPQAAIAPVLLTESLLGAGTPKLDFDFGYCDYCGKCIEVCPTHALEAFDKSSVRLGVARIDKAKCVAWDWRGCIKCYQECPAQAITLDENNRPIVDETLCNGCGKCQLVCLAPSLRSYNYGGGRAIIVVPRDRL
jgi:ferredoxin-type protein NapG